MKTTLPGKDKKKNVKAKVETFVFLYFVFTKCCSAHSVDSETPNIHCIHSHYNQQAVNLL